MTNLDSILKSRDILLPTKVQPVKAMVIPVVMYECESWTVKKTAQKNWCFWIAVLERTLEHPLDCKEVKPINPKGNQSWIFIGRTDAEAETPILWAPDVILHWLIGKDPDAGKDWRQEEKGVTEDKMVHSITDSMDMSLSQSRELVLDREVWHASVHGATRSRTPLSDWTELRPLWQCNVKRAAWHLYTQRVLL